MDRKKSKSKRVPKSFNRKRAALQIDFKNFSPFFGGGLSSFRFRTTVHPA
jgi:hypothetical protein